MRRLLPWALPRWSAPAPGWAPRWDKRTRPARRLRPFWWEPPRRAGCPASWPRRKPPARRTWTTRAWAPARIPCSAARPRGAAWSTSRPARFRTSETDHEMEWSSQNGGLCTPRPRRPARATSPSDRRCTRASGRVACRARLDEDARSPRQGALGLASADGFGVVLSPLTGSVTTVSVRELGTDSVDGAPATRYLVRTEPRPICPGPGRRLPGRAARSGSTATGGWCRPATRSPSAPRSWRPCARRSWTWGTSPWGLASSPARCACPRSGHRCTSPPRDRSQAPAMRSRYTGPLPSRAAADAAVPAALRSRSAPPAPGRDRTRAASRRSAEWSRAGPPRSPRGPARFRPWCS